MMSRWIEDTYESLRPLIGWLGATELVWQSYWRLRVDDVTRGYTTTVVVWIAGMLAWRCAREAARWSLRFWPAYDCV